MPEEEPRLDLAGNPLPPLATSAPMPAPSFAPPPRPVGPAAMPAYGGGAAYTPRSTFSETGGGSPKLKIGLSICGLLLVLLVAGFVVLTPKHTPAPTSFTAFSAADHSFSCAAPSGWTVTPAASGAKMSDGSESSVGGVLFQQNSASIDITTDTYVTLVAYDVMNNNADPQSLTGSKAGVLHKQWHKRIAAEHKGYSETQVANFDGAMGDGRLAEWTGASNALGFGGSLHGYRASLAGGGKTAVVVCSCLESDWPALKPAFQKVLFSLIAGQAASQEPAVPGSP